MASVATSVAVSLNKALAAPLGAILAGPKDMIETAPRLRAAMSGEWRPIGPKAAGAVAAIEQWRELLTVDHVNAFKLAARLKLRLGANIVSTPTTNLIIVQCPGEKAGIIAKLASERGVKVLPIGLSAFGFPFIQASDVAEALTHGWEASLAD